MDKKFYVSYEAARLLKEKGYSDFTKSVYRESNPSNTLFFKGESRDWNNMISPYTAAPTKAEAIDWLESKGIIVIAYYYKGEWLYLITPLLSEIEDKLIRKVFIRETYPSRFEAEEAAIIKALESL